MAQSRRQFLARSAQLGVLLGASVPLLQACGGEDATGFLYMVNGACALQDVEAYPVVTNVEQAEGCTLDVTWEDIWLLAPPDNADTLNVVLLCDITKEDVCGALGDGPGFLYKSGPGACSWIPPVECPPPGGVEQMSIPGAMAMVF